MSDISQPMEALQRAQALRLGGVRQRGELVGKPMRDVVAAIIHPTEELGCLRLRYLFTPNGSQRPGLVPLVGPVRLQQVFTELNAARPLGRKNWHAELKLRDLTEEERRQLARAVTAKAPTHWQEAAA